MSNKTRVICVKTECNGFTGSMELTIGKIYEIYPIQLFPEEKLEKTIEDKYVSLYCDDDGCYRPYVIKSNFIDIIVYRNNKINELFLANATNTL